MNSIEEILSDNTSGSGKILNNTITHFLEEGINFEEIPVIKILEETGKISNKFPLFALLHHFSNYLKEHLKGKTTIEGYKLVELIKHYKELYAGTQLHAAEKMLTELTLDKKNILLHSNSSSVKTLFNIISGKKSKPIIWQTVSSPAGEGILQASYLKKSGFTVHLFHEDAISHFITDIDMAIFGSDLISSDFFINKTGTFTLSLFLNHFEKPIYILAEKRKIERGKTTFYETAKANDEIMKNPGGIRVHNFYFEKIPLWPVSKVFTE